MFERRVRRSTKKNEALKLLLEAVRARSDVSSIAIVDEDGSLVSGAGHPRELQVLGAVAPSIAHGEIEDACRRMTEGTDVLARRLEGTEGETLYLAALGTRVRRMHEVARSVTRILRAA